MLPSTSSARSPATSNCSMPSAAAGAGLCLRDPVTVANPCVSRSPIVLKSHGAARDERRTPDGHTPSPRTSRGTQLRGHAVQPHQNRRMRAAAAPGSERVGSAHDGTDLPGSGPPKIEVLVLGPALPITRTGRYRPGRIGADGSAAAPSVAGALAAPRAASSRTRLAPLPRLAPETRAAAVSDLHVGDLVVLLPDGPDFSASEFGVDEEPERDELLVGVHEPAARSGAAWPGLCWRDGTPVG